MPYFQDFPCVTVLSMKPSIALRTIVGVSLLVATVVGCSKDDNQTRNAALPARTLSMRFVGAGTSNPVRGIIVKVKELATNSTFQAQSDANGNVRIQNLRSDEYSIAVNGTLAGYINGEITCGKPRKVVKAPGGCTHGATSLGDVSIARR